MWLFTPTLVEKSTKYVFFKSATVVNLGIQIFF